METPSRTCQWVCRRLPLLVGGELVGADRRRVERHLIGCAACRERRVASERSLEVLQLVARPAPADRPAPDEILSIWPALARQIRESKHQPDDAAARARRSARRAVGYGLAASLLLALGWSWATYRLGGGKVLPRPGSGTTPAVAAPGPPRPAGPATYGLDDAALATLDRLEVPAGRAGLHRSALPEGDATRAPGSAPGGANPFQPPLTLRLDYDLDRGTLAGPVVRDTQRAY